MASLDLWGAIAASFLLVQCIIFNLIFVALALGLWKGSEWLRMQTGNGLKKVDEWLQLGRGYIRQGERYVVSPFVRLRGRVAGVRSAWERLKG